MGRKKKNEEIVFCYYCDRIFKDEATLVQHQKASHFKCPECHRKLNTSQGLATHCYQVHKISIKEVPKAMPGRESIEIEIFGMAGVPPGMKPGAQTFGNEDEDDEGQPNKKARQEGDEPDGYGGPPPPPGMAPYPGHPYPGMPPPHHYPGMPPPHHMMGPPPPGMPRPYPGYPPPFPGGPPPPGFRPPYGPPHLPPRGGPPPPLGPPGGPPHPHHLAPPPYPGPGGPPPGQGPPPPHMPGMPPPPHAHPHGAPPGPLFPVQPGGPPPGPGAPLFPVAGGAAPGGPPAAPQGMLPLPKPSDTGLLWTDEEYSIEEHRARLPRYAQGPVNGHQ